MAMIEAFAQEIDQEGATTRRVLERVPADRLSWKPHQKSMSLGHLALHVAQTPGVISSWALKDVFEFTGPPPEPEAKSTAQILAAHDDSLKTAKDVLRQLGDAGLQRQWEGKAGGNTLMKLPKVALFRAVVLNHWIHHRGQLSVYLRLMFRCRRFTVRAPTRIRSQRSPDRARASKRYQSIYLDIATTS